MFLRAATSRQFGVRGAARSRRTARAAAESPRLGGPSLFPACRRRGGTFIRPKPADGAAGRRDICGIRAKFAPRDAAARPHGLATSTPNLRPSGCTCRVGRRTPSLLLIHRCTSATNTAPPLTPSDALHIICCKTSNKLNLSAYKSQMKPPVLILMYITCLLAGLSLYSAVLAHKQPTVVTMAAATERPIVRKVANTVKDVDLCTS